MSIGESVPLTKYSPVTKAYVGSIGVRNVVEWFDHIQNMMQMVNEELDSHQYYHALKASNISAYCEDNLYIYFAQNGHDFEFVSLTTWPNEAIAWFQAKSGSKIRFICESEGGLLSYANFIASVKYAGVSYPTLSDFPAIDQKIDVIDAPYYYIESLTTQHDAYAAFFSLFDQTWLDAYISLNVSRPARRFQTIWQYQPSNLTFEFHYP